MLIRPRAHPTFKKAFRLQLEQRNSNEMAWLAGFFVHSFQPPGDDFFFNHTLVDSAVWMAIDLSSRITFLS
jgi:hypothetical protein